MVAIVAMVAIVTIVAIIAIVAIIGHGQDGVAAPDTSQSTAAAEVFSHW